MMIWEGKIDQTYDTLMIISLSAARSLIVT